MPSSTFASLRNKYSTSDVTVTVGSGGSTTSAYSLGLRVFGVSRAGKNINSDRIAVSVSAGQQVTITLNSTLRASGEDIYRIGIAGETTGNDANSFILAEFEAKQSNQISDITFSPIVLSRDQHFVLNGTVANYASLPSNPINGTARFATAENKYYLYRLGSWVEVNGLSTYTVLTTEKRTVGKLYGGCDLPIISLDTGEFIPIPEYDAAVGGNSYPLKLWLLNGTEEVGGAVIPRGNFIDLELLLNGSSSDAAVMSGRVTATALGKVRKLTGVSTNTDITSTSAIWEYNNSNLFVVPENINAGYALAFSVVFNFTELSDGDNLSFRIYDKGLFSIPEPALGIIFGNGIFPVAPYCRIVPSLSGIRRLPGEGLIEENRFQATGSYDTGLGLLVDNNAQKVVISGVLIGQVRVRAGGEALLSTEAVRAIISTEPGIAPASSWSSPVSLLAGQQISVIVGYPCNNAGIGTIRSDYPDVIAANSGGDFTPVRLRVEVRRSGTIYQQSNATIVPNATQTFIISSLGSAGSSPSVNSDPDFNLWGYSGISVSAIAGSSSLAAGSYEVRVYYEYPSPNFVVTKISHATNAGCIPELLANYSDVVNASVYGGLISSSDTTRNYLLNKLTAGSGIVLEKLFAGGNERIRITASGVGGGGGGGVSSVGLSMPGIFSVSNSPVTTTGTLAVALISQSANLFLASPNGAPGVPTFRAMGASDVPSLPTSKITTGIFPIARLASGTPNGTKFIADDGTLKTPTGGHIITESGVVFAQRNKLDFRGAPVDVRDDAANDTTIIDITQINGAAATIAVGAVTTGALGSAVTVTNTGTSSNAVFAFSIPSGATGAIGNVNFPPQFTKATSSGVISATWASQSPNLFLASPSGATGIPDFRIIASTDIPSIPASKITSGVLPIARLATGTPDGSKFIRDDGVLAVPPGGGGGGGGRFALTANRIYYVRTDGSNSNDGLSDNSSGAFLTIQKAIDEWVKVDNAGFATTILVRAGTFNMSTPLILKNGLGGGTLTIEGAGSTTIIDFNTGTVPVYACAIYGEYIVTLITLKTLKVAVSNTGSRISFVSLITLIGANISLNAITFGANNIVTTPYGGQILALNGSTVTLQGSTFTIDGGWTTLGGGSQAAFIWAESGSRVFFDLQPRVFMVSSSTIAYDFFFTARSLSSIRYWGQGEGNGVDWSGITATGSRYRITGNSVLDSLNFTSQESSLPGNSGGTILSGSQFI